MRRVLKPELTPSDKYSYLRFIGDYASDWYEVYLPDDSSYVLYLEDLKTFLYKCGVEDWEGLVDCIYNFGNVIWNRMDQRYYPVIKDEILPKEMLENRDPLEEIPYVFN